jgi:hypothetical protein
MPETEDDLTEEQKQLYRKTRVPHKFSWMRVPEPIPYDEPPKQPPRSLPQQERVFTPRVVIVIALILGVLFAFILVLVLVTRGKAAELAPAALAFSSCLCLVEARGRSRGQCALSRTSTRFARCSTATSRHRPA